MASTRQAPIAPSGRPLPSGVVAFLLTDIEGSTKRWETWPSQMAAALARHDACLRAAILRSGGHLFRAAGDAFYAAFASPSMAVTSAVHAQRALAAEDFGEVGGLRVRMAVHAGPVEARGQDYFGQGINRCARILSFSLGGQVLVSATVADMARGDLPEGTRFFDLGSHCLKDIAEPERIFQLVAPDLPTDFPPIRSAGGGHNLPEQLTTFVGREMEAAEVEARLERHRLVTLVGSGGAGKTRVALHVAARLVAAYPDGFWFVELAAIEDPKLVAETLCGTVGVPVQGGRSATESAVAFLRHRRALLVLDNCEHLVAAAALLLEELVRACPSLSVLATSRERLAVPGESTFRLPSLAIPPTADDLTAEAALRFEAVRLFVERATATVEGFALTDANAAAVANICRHLDGIPMAIELAVPQLRMMRPQGLAARLRDRFLLLAGGSRTALPRHQTVRMLFDWSYNLLSESEQALLRRLSVFAGGWTLEAAAAVTGGEPVAAADVYDLVGALIDKSLVVPELSGEEPRYRFLETTRQYAADKLRESGERGRRRRLAEEMIAFYGEATAAWPTMPTDAWLARYEADLDNLRISLDWAFKPEGDVRLGVALASVSLRIWDERSLLPERERWSALAVRSIDADTEPAVAARLWLGHTSPSAHGDRASFETVRRAAELFREAGDPFGLGEALAKAGAALLTPATTEEAAPLLDEAHGILRALSPSKPLASCLRSLGVARYFVGDFAAARAFVAQSAETARAVGDRPGIAAAQIAAAELDFAAGAVDDAIAEVGAMLAAVVRALEHLAGIAAATGDAPRAARLLGYGEAFYAAGTASREHTEQSTCDRLVADLDRLLPKDRVAALMSEGAAWTEDQAVAAATAA